MWQLDVEQLLQGGFATLALAPVAAVTEQQLPGVIARMRDRVEKSTKHPLAPKLLWNATTALMGLRYSADFIRALMQGVLMFEDSSVYKAALAVGRKEGISQGLNEGLDLGEQREAKKFLLLMGESRFGPPNQKVRKALDRITDVPRLEALGLRLLQVGSWEELLAPASTATPAPPKPRHKNGKEP